MRERAQNFYRYPQKKGKNMKEYDTKICLQR